MPLRNVEPFDDEQWAKLMKDMKKGASKEQIANLKRAEEHMRTANVTFDF